MDILDYPSTIGICDNAGFHSPMAIASDCPATSAPGPVCNSIGGLYTVGDPAVAAFSACDLTCNHLHEQTITPPDDTYQGCSFPAVGWTVAQTTTTASVYRTTAAVVVGNSLVTATSVASSGTDTPQDLTLKGPFSATDPTGASAAELHEDLDVYASEANEEVVLKVIDIGSGQPVSSFHLKGDGEDYVDSISAGGPGGTTLALGGNFQGSITATTSVCTPYSASFTNEAGEDVLHTVQCAADGTTTATGHHPPGRGSSWGAHLDHQVNALLEEYRELYNMKYINPVVVTMTASGSLSDYADTSSLQEKFAAAAGVDVAEITIIVQAGSVVMTAIIAVRHHVLRRG